MLELSLTEIGIHILNVVILFVALRLLLYKPILKFIKKREKTFADKIDEFDTREKELTRQKEQYKELIANADSEAASIIAKSNELASDRAKEIVDNAKGHSRDLVLRAKKEIVAEKLQTQADLKVEIANMAVQVSEKILEREVSIDDNRKIIDEFFERVG